MVPISCTIKKYINVLFSSSVNDGRQEKNFVLIYVVVINALYRKDSFVTHRAFCDALTEENYKANQNISNTGGMLQNHAQELFISSMPSSDSCSNTNTAMNSSISNENIGNSLKPVSLNSAAAMISGNIDPIFNPRTPGTCFITGGGSNAFPMAIGSCYTSATALLRKAAAMGAKISDNSIAPILLRGSTGYSTATGSMNLSRYVQDSSSVVGNMGPITMTNNGSLLEDQVTNDKTLDTGKQRPNYTVSQSGLLPSTLSMHSENGHAGDLLRQVHIGGGEKMTVDFLGVEPAGNLSVGRKRSYDSNVGVGVFKCTAKHAVPE